ncbi:histidine kinase dimerization/phospho-acceptor domain-containing protein [Nocardioides sp. cx-173]|uniref:histidine kinase dimerization/phospho-acceptor domain-containing protein n=1 Tax=Nocardioides sp. cx-173 TaxID=2898796 RepID=UPI001E5CD739|nr:histidine kinase dimerization/phospho-acceptor domain-containing protein [Nocardioides sp. cx-173]MCD4524527.1 HAMP domain-containing protein [Nocardioides sp. cx-173]UGB42988.1 HAMP domain-containing protein [Nocardioides sp. cx-173]
MRRRLTLAFLLVTLSMILLAGIVRAVTLDGMLREREGEHLFREATTLASVIEANDELARPVDRAFLEDFVGPDTEIVYAPADGPRAVVTGPDFRDGDDGITSTISLDGGKVTVRQSAGAIQNLWGRDSWSVVALFAVTGLGSALIGFVISGSLAAPFQKLAVAASALGRGRFDLDLPPSRVPEARAITEALRSSATALRERLTREQQFALHASHVLRTPLTTLRLELEEMTLDEDLPATARAAAQRCMTAVDDVTLVASDLVDLSRRGLIGGAQVPLRELATSCAQHWSDELDEYDRRLTAAVEGDLDLTFTPGPVEQVLDLLLRDRVAHGLGDTRLVLEGDPRGHLRLLVRGARRPDADDELLDEARAVIEALGGRLEAVRGEGHPDQVVLLPRR